MKAIETYTPGELAILEIKLCQKQDSLRQAKRSHPSEYIAATQQRVKVQLTKVREALRSSESWQRVTLAITGIVLCLFADFSGVDPIRVSKPHRVRTHRTIKTRRK